MVVYYKMLHMLLQNALAILSQIATEVYYIMRQVFYYKIRQFYYKMETVITKCEDFITKCDTYYKMRHLLQIGTVHES